MKIMMYNWLGADFVQLAIKFTLSFIALLAGSITDLKTREVPDWLNYGLVISGIGVNLLLSIIYSNLFFIANSIAGLLVFFIIAYVMFYAGQWGGGDSKMLMGLGSMIGIDVQFKTSQFLLGFFVNALFIGAIYGLLWSILLIFKNKKKFLKELNKILVNKPMLKAKKIILIAMALMFVVLFIVRLPYAKVLILSIAFLALTSFYLWIFVKAVEKSSMYRLVEPSKLTEGDWIVKDVIVDKEHICGPKDLGIEKSQIRRLIKLYRQGKVKKILIKEGIPFVPSFLISFITTFILGNPLAWFI